MNMATILMIFNACLSIWNTETYVKPLEDSDSLRHSSYSTGI